MGTFLFDDIIFGPVKSRRLGISLGVNLLPIDYKYCTFNCIYCECGWTQKENQKKIKLPTREQIVNRFLKKVKELKEENIIPDHITFAGNGEPTIHPQFAEVIKDTINIRDEYFPKAEITVLTNATQVHKKSVFNALNTIENNVVKLDTVIEETYQNLNNPLGQFKLEKIIENIKKFNGSQVIQTLFVRGEYDGKVIDNTTEEEVGAWLKVIKDINPKHVMIYPIDRDTAAEGLEKISKEELDLIAEKVRKTGLKAVVSY